MMQMRNALENPRYKKRERRPPQIPTPESLANAAFAYVARFASTEAALRRVLRNRIRKAALAHPAFSADAATQAALHAVIETLIEKHRRIGAVDDAAYAGMKAGALRRAGRSKRFIQQKLLMKGVGAELAQTALTASDAEKGDERAELDAALLLARRKKLGRFRAEGKTLDADGLRKQSQRDMAMMARNGFSFGVAKQALGAADDEDGEAFI